MLLALGLAMLLVLAGLSSARLASVLRMFVTAAAVVVVLLTTK